VTNPGGQRVMLAGGFLYLTAFLTVTPGVVTPGGQLQVSWAIPASRFSDSDWIGLAIVGGSDFDYLDYQNTNGATSGTQTWTAPAQPGLYEFRYFRANLFDYVFDDDDFDVVARSSPVTVAGAASAATGGAQTTIRRAGRGGSPRRLEK
jgi:hypothetical protein